MIGGKLKKMPFHFGLHLKKSSSRIPILYKLEK